ncbi:MAG: CRTAC1 family protein [Planctomycetes bacterium]|nr:CRTAC1 family protein [Planctomycetota bacterium]
MGPRRSSAPTRAAALAILLASAACSDGADDPPPSGGGGPAPAPLVFADWTAPGPSGVDFTSLSRMDAAGYGQGAAVADVDGDGDLDIFLSQDDGPCALLLNDGRARFTEVAAAAGVRVSDAAHAKSTAFLDYDRDGDPDLFVGRAGEGNLLFRNRGDGTFEDATAAAGIGGGAPFTMMAAVGDFDGDGWPDLYECNFAVTDYDEPLSEQGTPAPNRLWRNGRDGTFTDVAGLLGVDDPLASWAAHWLDVDGDGDQDLLVANDRFFFPSQSTRDRLFLNTGPAGGFSFEERGVEWGLAESHFGMGVALGDVDGDGTLDIYVSDLGDNELYLGSDAPPLVDRAPAWGLEAGWAGSQRLTSWGAAVADLDADGWNDLVVGNGFIHPRDPGPMATSQVPHLYLRRPETPGVRFEEAGEAAGLRSLDLRGSRGVIPCDLDGDGLLDLVVSTRFGKARILRGEGPRPEAWYGVRLRGTRSTTEGLGAILELRVGDRRWVRLVTTGGQPLCSLPPEALFHPGGARGDPRLRVRWPSGAVQDVVPARRSWTTVIEPE